MAPDTSIIHLNTAAPEAAAVYLIAGRGGHAAGYRELAEKLSPNWQVNGVLYPLFIGSDKSYDTVHALANDMTPDIAALPDPIILGGYSMGGAVAYEIACLLERRGRSVGVVMIDTRIDQLRPNVGTWRKYLRRILVRWPRRLLKGLGLIKARQKPARNTWRPRDAKQAAFFETTGKAMRAYEPTRSRVKIVMIKARPEPRVSWLSTRRWKTKAYGWHRVARVSKVILCTGNHSTITRPEHRDKLAAALSIAFAKTLRSLSTSVVGDGAVRED